MPLAVTPAPPDAAAGELLDEAASKRLIAAAGVALPEGRLVAPDGGRRRGRGLGFPVVVKLCSADLPHKADAGAVAARPDDRRRRGDAPSRRMLARNAGVALSGVLVERMVEGGAGASCWSG